MKAENVVIAGGGGHALSLMEFAGSHVAGYLANGENTEMSVPWLGTDEALERIVKEGYLLHMAFVYSGLPVMNKREALIAKYREAGASFVTLKAPTATVTPNSVIGSGCALMCGCIINRAKLGENVIVNSGAIIEHDCEIGANTFIGPGAVVGGFTSIGRNCFIGLGAKIGNGIKIGDNITVGMGCVVNRDLVEAGIYHGVNLRHSKIPIRWRK